MTSQAVQAARKPYPSDAPDWEWALVAPYLALLPEASGQRRHSLREVFNTLCHIVRMGGAWRMMPHDLPPWPIVYQQPPRWFAASVFEALVHDLRVLRRSWTAGTPQSTPESGARAGHDGARRRRG